MEVWYRRACPCSNCFARNPTALPHLAIQLVFTGFTLIPNKLLLEMRIPHQHFHIVSQVQFPISISHLTVLLHEACMVWGSVLLFFSGACAADLLVHISDLVSPGPPLRPQPFLLLRPP